MKTTATADPVIHALALAAIALEGAAACLRATLVPALALALTLAGYRPAPAAAEPVAALPPVALSPVVAALPAAPVARDWAGRPLEWLPVRELRQIARAQGHRALARSGRRADLLAVLVGEG